MNDCCEGTCHNDTCTNTTNETHLQYQILHHDDSDSDSGNINISETVNTTKSVIKTASEVEYLQLIQAEMSNLSSQLTVLNKLATLQGRLLCISAQRQHLV